MDEVYRRLAAKLDGLPNGYPATETGVELRILERIFRPEDAALALRLKPIPEPPTVIARRLGEDPAVMEEHLEEMAARGQIASMRFRGRQCYCLVPFVVGIWEYQVAHLDAELAALVEEYAPALMRTLGGSAPALARVVPVNVSLESHAEVLSHEDMRRMIEGARSFRIAECICRKERELQGFSCTHARETCLAFSRQENAYERFPTWGRVISREEALAVLAAAEEEGLVHATYNVREDQMFVCNCCSCCCGFLRGIREHDAPHLLVRSNFVAAVDADACAACGACAERCPVDAISNGDDVAGVDGQRCIGCGVCLPTCPTEAVSLVARPETERTTPPRTLIHWSLARAAHRSGPLGAVALGGRLAWEMVGGSLRRERNH